MGNKLIVGKNDFKSWCENNNKLELLNEWDSSNEIKPEQISYGSHKVVKWVCRNGHVFEKDIHSRCQGTKCSICSGIDFKKRKTFFMEYPELIDELDITKNDFESVKYVTSGSIKRIFWICEKGHSYEMAVANKVKSKGCPYCNNNRVLNGFNDLKTWCEKNERTQILEDWDYSKNIIKPTEITYGSNKKVWFKCHICGHEWKTVVGSRTGQHSDCRMCTRRISSSFPEQCIYYYLHMFFPDAINGDRIVLEGRELDIWIPSMKFAIEYDGKKWHKDIIKDIDKDKICEDKGIILYRIRENGIKELKSSNSISFEYNYGDWNLLSKIISEILHDMGIDYSDVNILRDEYKIKEQYYKQSLDNSLANLYPELAKEWHPTRNGKITPNLIIAETHDLYFWLCPLGHTYKASPKNRIRMNSGCPYCSNKKILRGFNDIETTHPDIALDYDNKKNIRKSYEVSRGCSDLVWLKCHKCGYEFEYVLNAYISGGGLCPACSRTGKTKFKKVLKYETMEVFDTLPLAAKTISRDENDIKRIYKNIHKACNGETNTAYGFHWFYVSVDKNGDILDDISSFVIKESNRSIVGCIKEMNNGQRATVIRDEGYKDIDIQFEDGTIVHTNRQAFRSGKVKNPKKNSVEGMTRIMKTGEKAVCLKDYGSKDVDVQFEDATIVHTNRQAFKMGKVNNPNSENKRVGGNNNKKNIEGMIQIMKTGEKAICIKDNGWNDIDVRFEDGTVVEHVMRRNFVIGAVNNPNYLQTLIGKKSRMECGLDCEIIAIKSKTDITVMFENGEIVEHTTLLKFNRGKVLTMALSKQYKYIIGQRRLMNCGLYATVIADRGAHDIDVKFDDGTVVYNKDRANFNRGNICVPRNTSIKGMSKMMNNGMMATVISDEGWDNIDVKFENGVVVKHRRRDHFKKGSISF